MQKIALFVALCVFAVAGHAQKNHAWDKTVMAGEFDLDGDGKRETIRVQKAQRAAPHQDEAAFRLSVDGQSLFDSDDGEVLGFGLADLDTKDRFKEIFVRSVGIADDNSDSVYRFQGGKLTRVGKVWEATFEGNGMVRCAVWLGFAQSEKRFRLNSNGRLVEVKQRLYPVRYAAPGAKEWKGTGQHWLPVLQPVELRAARSKTARKSFVARGAQLKFLSTDLSGWFWVRSNRGQSGWIRVEDVSGEKIGGLIFAG